MAFAVRPEILPFLSAASVATARPLSLNIEIQLIDSNRRDDRYVDMLMAVIGSHQDADVVDKRWTTRVGANLLMYYAFAGVYKLKHWDEIEEGYFTIGRVSLQHTFLTPQLLHKKNYRRLQTA